MDRLKDKVSLVTGAAGGLGSAIVRRLHAEGAAVVMTDRDEAAVRALAAEYDERVLAFAHDVTDEKAWQRVIADTLEHFGCLDVLVNNAGIVHVGTVEDTTLEDFQRVNAVHSEGTFLGCKHALPAMRASGEGSGSLINMSSVTAIGGFPYVIAYAAAKGAIRSMTKAIAAGTSAEGEPIRCNSIHPGRIATAMVASCGEGREKLGDRRSAGNDNPPGEPDDVAHLVVYLASDESAWMNGSELIIDNGATITDGSVSLRVRR